MKFFITVIYLLFFNVSFAQEHVNSISAKEKKEMQSLENKIAKLETERETLDKSLATLSPNDFEKSNDIYIRMGEASQALEKATERWLILAEKDG